MKIGSDLCQKGEDAELVWGDLDSCPDWLDLLAAHPERNQSWIFIGRTDAEAEAKILWLPDAKNWLIGKDPDAGKDWGQEEKGTTEDEMVGWHHRLSGHGFGWTPGVGDGQGGLEFCGSWDRKVSHMTEQLNWTELILYIAIKNLSVGYNYFQKEFVIQIRLLVCFWN